MNQMEDRMYYNLRVGGRLFCFVLFCFVLFCFVLLLFCFGFSIEWMQRRMLFRRRNYRFTVGVKITISWADVGTSARFFPLTDEFVLEDFGASLARQASFIETELAHLHVIFSGGEQDRWFVRM